MILEKKEYVNIIDVYLKNREKYDLLEKELGFDIEINNKFKYSTSSVKIRKTRNVIKDKMKLSDGDFFQKYHDKNMISVYNIYTKNGARLSSSKRIIGLCKKYDIETISIIGKPSPCIGTCNPKGEDYDVVYLFDKTTSKIDSPFCKEIIKYYDLVTVTLYDVNGKPYEKVIPFSKKEYCKLKLSLNSTNMYGFIKGTSFRLITFLTDERRNDPNIIKIMEKHIKPVYLKTGTCYAISNYGEYQRLEFAIDHGWKIAGNVNDKKN